LSPIVIFDNKVLYWIKTTTHSVNFFWIKFQHFLHLWKVSPPYYTASWPVQPDWFTTATVIFLNSYTLVGNFISFLHSTRGFFLDTVYTNQASAQLTLRTFLIRKNCICFGVGSLWRHIYLRKWSRMWLWLRWLRIRPWLIPVSWIDFYKWYRYL
jgi:hypothetical protein